LLLLIRLRIDLFLIVHLSPDTAYMRDDQHLLASRTSKLRRTNGKVEIENGTWPIRVTGGLKSNDKACGAGGSIKPGALAPGQGASDLPARNGGQQSNRVNESRSMACRPLCGPHSDYRFHPGADAPGFMLSPASQARPISRLLLHVPGITPRYSVHILDEILCAA